MAGNDEKKKALDGGGRKNVKGFGKGAGGKHGETGGHGGGGEGSSGGERGVPGLGGVPPCPGGLRVTGRLAGGVYRLPGGDTSQLISGMLMALPLCREDSRLEAPGPVSRPYVDLTAWVLERYGVVLHRAQGGWRIPGGQRFAPLPLEQEGGWAAAAYWPGAAAPGPGDTGTGVRAGSPAGTRCPDFGAPGWVRRSRVRRGFPPGRPAAGRPYAPPGSAPAG